MIKKVWKLAAVCLLFACLLCLSGCEFANRGSENELQADEEGKLLQTIVEPIDQSIAIDELKQYIQDQIAASDGKTGSENGQTGSSSAADAGSGSAGSDTGIELESCQNKDGKFQIRIRYGNYEKYTAFNGTACFCGTISAAQSAGYSFDLNFLNEKGKPDDSAAETIAERANEWKVLIVEEPMRLRVPDKILYTSDNLKVSGRTTAVVQKQEQASKDASDTEAEAEDASDGDAAQKDPAVTPGMEQFVIDDFSLYYVIFK